MPDKNKLKKRRYLFHTLNIHENERIHENIINNIEMRKKEISFIDIISLLFILLIIILYFYFSYISMKNSLTGNNFIFD